LSTERKAANVFPVPVGETINTFLPLSIKGHAAACAGVGSAKRDSNQRVTGDLFRNGIAVDSRGWIKNRQLTQKDYGIYRAGITASMSLRTDHFAARISNTGMSVP
jgi:hypothetical protein